MAELYDYLCEDCLPFNSQIASDRAQNLIDQYLKNDGLKTSKSIVIKKHLEELEKERHSSELFSAIRALNQDSMRDQKLNNLEIGVCQASCRLNYNYFFVIIFFKVRI